MTAGEGRSSLFNLVNFQFRESAPEGLLVGFLWTHCMLRFAQRYSQGISRFCSAVLKGYGFFLKHGGLE